MKTRSPSGRSSSPGGRQPARGPTDAWSQLLFYRKDLFDAAGLDAPETYDDITALPRRSTAPRLLGSSPPLLGDAFTQQTFEHLALANGCEMVDESGEVTLDSDQCVASFDFFGDLMTNYWSPAPRTSTPYERTTSSARPRWPSGRRSC